MKKQILAAGIAGGLLVAASAAPIATFAATQQDTASPVTTRPASLAGQVTPTGTDSTLQCSQGTCGTSVGGNSTVTVGSASPPSPPPPSGPGLTCIAGVIGSRNQTVNACPSGSLAYDTNAAIVKQTQQEVRSCPSGPNGAPSDAWGAWAPTATVGTGPNDGCGYPSGTNVQIGVNNQANFYGAVAGTTGSYPMGPRGGNPGGPSAQFSGTWTWNGQTMFVQVRCNGSELCTNNIVRNIGGANWNFKVWGSSLLPGDCVLPRPPARPSCPLGGSGAISAQ